MPSARGAFGKFPLITEKHVEKTIVPYRRIGRPCAFKTACYGFSTASAPMLARPSETLFLNPGSLWLGTNAGRVSGTMTLAECVSACNQGDSFFIVHSHAPEGLADVMRRCKRVGLGVGSFGIDVDKSHLHGAKRIVKLAIAAVTFISQPFGLRTPVDVLFRLPYVLAPAGKTEGLKTHGLKSAVASENHKVRPGDFATVFLLYRP